MEYTKGNWRVEDGTQVVSGERLIANTGGYSTLGFSFVDCLSVTRKENIANAHLIAASPRMVNLLERLVNDGWNASISEEAKEILAQAEEKTP